MIPLLEGHGGGGAGLRYLAHGLYGLVQITCDIGPKKILLVLPILIISPNEVLGDIMVLASPPVDPDDVNS